MRTFPYGSVVRSSGTARQYSVVHSPFPTDMLTDEIELAWLSDPNTGSMFYRDAGELILVSEPKPLVILNTTIITGTPGIYHAERISEDEARSMVRYALEASDIQDGSPITGLVSAVGHQATAEVATMLLGTRIEQNRMQFQQQVGQCAIAVKLLGRPPEGVIFSREEMDAMGYELILLTRES